jgi:hypothetical protein
MRQREENIMRYNFAMTLPIVAALLATAPSVRAQTPSSAQAQTLGADATAAEEAFAAALGCTARRASAVALKAVGGGHVIFVVFDRFDRPPHWDVFIINFSSDTEYLVWVNVACKVTKIFTDSP